MPQTDLRKCIAAFMLTAAFAPAQASAAWTFKTVYAFQGGNDGAYPYAAVVETGGKLYGTTDQGGGSGCGNSGCGSIFKLTTAGKEAVLFSFGSGGSGGNSPIGPLINVSGTFYGMTHQGGVGVGVVYSITPSGTENTLHTFQGNSSDGGYPYGGLINVNGTLYGTNASYGASGSGTIFSVTTGGQEKVLYNFKGGSDGQYPQAGLINVSGTLYGTTWNGGANGDGTVFKVTQAGTETVLYSFKGGADGSRPRGELTNVHGTLYGTTYSGGGTGCGGSGCGTVFKITQAGAETLVYAFQGGNDGANPEARLIDRKGTLFGTTLYGGGAGCTEGAGGCGTIFEVTTGGAVKLLHTFSGASDGSWPQAGLINVNGTLFGTTSGGISTNCSGGCGSVFALSN